MDEKDFIQDFPECATEPNSAFNSILSRINTDWLNILTHGDQSVKLDGIISTLKSRYKDPYNQIRPAVEDIFNAFRFTHLGKIKVVILGQDPYYSERHAHGLSFSSKQSNVPKSLQTIFNCLLKQGFIKTKPLPYSPQGVQGTGPADLTSWAAQGVLLLNTALTTEEGKANAHVDLWSSYMDNLITLISAAYEQAGLKIVWMLWGKVAQAKRPRIVGHHYILEFMHPAAYCDWSECPTFKQHADIVSQPGGERLKIDWDSINHPNDVMVEAFTDGSTNPNIAGPEAISGYAVMIVKCYSDIKARNCWGNPTSNAPYWTTNNRAEGQALLDLFTKVKEIPTKNRELLHIVMDSEFWINMIFEFMPKWKPEDFSAKKNPDLTIPIWNAYKELMGQGTMITITHVPSHGKKLWHKEPADSWRFYCSKYNGFVDNMAKEARTKLKPGTVIWQ